MPCAGLVDIKSLKTFTFFTGVRAYSVFCMQYAKQGHKSLGGVGGVQRAQAAVRRQVCMGACGSDWVNYCTRCCVYHGTCATSSSCSSGFCFHNLAFMAKCRRVWAYLVLGRENCVCALPPSIESFHSSIREICYSPSHVHNASQNLHRLALMPAITGARVPRVLPCARNQKRGQ